MSIEPVSLAYYDFLTKKVQQKTMPCSNFCLKIGLLEVEGTCMHQWEKEIVCDD